ncbi:MAG: EAL domain-containing protein [Planctomycetota bacterium]|jgi:lactose/cellobiose-specific phosphotransferase system IIC component|nr:EAL domain-containing protein [Planctomycetota bacterium]
MIELMIFISRQRAFRAIQRGLVLMIPLLLAGSLGLVINFFPLPAYQDAMLALFGPGWRNFGNYVFQGTFSIMSLGILISISHSLIEAYAHDSGSDLHPLFGSLVSMACYIVVMNIIDDDISIRLLGPLGLFMAIIIGVLSSGLFIRLYSLKSLRIRIFSDSADPTVGQSLRVLLAAMLTIAAFAILHLLFEAAGVKNIQDYLYELFRHVFGDVRDSSLGTALIFVFTVHLFWFFGMHGSNVMEPIMMTVFYPNLEMNRLDLAAGLVPERVFTKEFFDIFILQGGCGSTICLILAVLIFQRRNNTRQISLVSSIPGLFNVNEPMVYGLPIVMNPFFLVPFIFFPLVLVLTTAGAMHLGLVPVVTNSVNWTTPILLSGYLATGSPAGAALQAFNVTLGIAFYAPFVRIFQSYKDRDNREALRELTDIVLDGGQNLILRGDRIGNLARSLAVTLREDFLEAREIGLNDAKACRRREGSPPPSLFFHYQPQIRVDGTLHGVEALLRWRHPQLGFIPPPVAIALADDIDLERRLCHWTIHHAFSDLSNWNREGLRFILSINLSPTQIYEELAGEVAEALRIYGIRPGEVELEVTEQLALTPASRRRLASLKELGVRIAMDDFGMGHTSLMYLKEFDLDTIKLDGVLIRDVASSATSRDIISSIAHLAKASNLEIVAEYVETPEQSEVLARLGCAVFQGYLFSRPLSPSDLGTYAAGLNAGSKVTRVVKNALSPAGD